MRARTLGLVVCLLAASGCVVGFDDQQPQATGGANPADLLPDEVDDRETVQAGLAPVDRPTTGACLEDGPGCYEYPFETGIDTIVQARLEWENATNDFDLAIKDADGGTVAEADDDGLGTAEELEATLEPGEYALAVVARTAMQDTFRIQGHFGFV
jgi:hypothetical protein